MTMPQISNSNCSVNIRCCFISSKEDFEFLLESVNQWDTLCTYHYLNKATTNIHRTVTVRNLRRLGSVLLRQRVLLRYIYYTSCKNLLISLNNRHLTFLNSFFWCRNQIVITPSAVISPFPSRTLPNRKIKPEICRLVISGKFTM
jgi:hypothetical protein